MDGGMFEMAIGADGMEHLSIDARQTATELMNGSLGKRAEFEVGGEEVRAVDCQLISGFSWILAILTDRDLVLVVDASRFDHPHQAVKRSA
jgi:hypothetical protein